MENNEKTYYAGVDMTSWDFSYTEDDPKFIYKAFIALCNYAEEFGYCNQRCPLYELCFSKNGKDGKKFWDMVHDKLIVNKISSSMNGCEGCIHYDGCGYFDFDNNDLTEEERFAEHCVGCCCGDGYDCNKGNGCDNWEDGSEWLMG